MAIVFAMGHFKVYLYGREFIVRTDHRPLQWLKNLASPSTRLARWLLMVRQFEFKIEFVSGISNAAADALSRFSSSIEVSSSMVMKKKTIANRVSC